MYRKLASAGVKVPNGFAITAEAYRYFLRETGVDAQIKDIPSRAGYGRHREPPFARDPRPAFAHVGGNTR
jgi:hypothetical protein